MRKHYKGKQPLGKVIVVAGSYAPPAVATALGEEGIPVVVFAADRHGLSAAQAMASPAAASHGGTPDARGNR